MPRPKTRKRKSEGSFTSQHFLLFIILALGLLIRLWGISFGLPDLYHADEPIVVNHALAYGTGDLNPHFFKIPPLTSYVLFVIYGLFYLIARCLSWIHSTSDFQNLFFQDPSSFYLLGRMILGAFLGTATILVFYRLIKRFFSQEHAILCGFFLAFSFLHVRDSHYIYTDIPLLLLIVASFFPIFKILERGKKKDYLIFGLLAGAAVATKYNGVFIFIPFLLAHFQKEKFKPSSFFDSRLVLAGFVALATYSLLNPFTWLDFHSFFQETFLQSRAEGFMGFAHHLIYSLAGGVGIPILLLTLWAVFLFVVRLRADLKTQKGAKKIVLLSFIATYYLILCFKSQPYDRYVLPLVPFVIFFAAEGVVAIRERLKFSKVMVWVLVYLIALPGIIKIYLSDQLFAREDIRTVAKQRVMSIIPPGSKIALDVSSSMPSLRPNVAQLEEKKKYLLSLPSSHAKGQLRRLDSLIEQAKKDNEARYELYFLNNNKEGSAFLFTQPSIPYDLKGLARLGIQYVIAARINRDYEKEFYQSLTNQATLLAKFSPYKDRSLANSIDEHDPLTGGPFSWWELKARERNGHTLELYKLK